MTLTIGMSILLALFGGLAVLATAHARLFCERWATPILIAAVAVSCLTVAYQAGMGLGFSTLLKFVVPTKFEEATAAFNAAGDIPAFVGWASAGLVIYLFVLRAIAAHIANDKIEREGQSKQP